MSDSIQADKRSITVNPAHTNTYTKSDWSVAPPKTGEYEIWMSQNQVTPLICGDDYLPALRKALEEAQKSIYITVWGFDAALPLVFSRHTPDRQQHLLGELLKHKAEEDKVTVKILVWYNSVAELAQGNFPGYRFSKSNGDSHYTPPRSGLPNKAYRKNWLSAASSGNIPNLQLATRSTVQHPDYFHDNQAEINALEEQTQQAHHRQAQYQHRDRIRGAGFGINKDYQHPYEVNPALQLQDAELIEQVKRLKQGYLDGLGEEYQQKGLTFPRHGALKNFTSHHQKAIIIDHELPAAAIGFVQGFNLLPNYFDFKHHPYDNADRFPGADQEQPLQDLAVRIQGGCLPDLFRNFKQSWNLHAKNHPNITDPVQDGARYSKHLAGYKSSAQILRSYPLTRERNIEQWCYRAISRMNNCLYIEDQYFRHAGFAQAIIKRAQQKQGPLYIFVVTLEAGAVAMKAREETLQTLNRDDLLMSEKKAEQDGDKKRATAMTKMTAAGVFVHLCRLRTSKDIASHGSGRNTIPAYTDYKDIYVHSKLMIVDNAHYLIGSANQNIRSMQTDTELSIAVEDTRKSANKVIKLRTDLWNQHVNSIAGELRWFSADSSGNLTTPKQWYKDWQKTMTKNDVKYQTKKPRISNIFTLYEKRLLYINAD